MFGGFTRNSQESLLPRQSINSSDYFSRANSVNAETSKCIPERIFLIYQKSMDVMYLPRYSKRIKRYRYRREKRIELKSNAQNTQQYEQKYEWTFNWVQTREKKRCKCECVNWTTTKMEREIVYLMSDEVHSVLSRSLTHAHMPTHTRHKWYIDIPSS